MGGRKMPRPPTGNSPSPSFRGLSARLDDGCAALPASPENHPNVDNPSVIPRGVNNLTTLSGAPQQHYSSTAVIHTVDSYTVVIFSDMRRSCLFHRVLTCHIGEFIEHLRRWGKLSTKLSTGWGQPGPRCDADNIHRLIPNLWITFPPQFTQATRARRRGRARR